MQPGYGGQPPAQPSIQGGGKGAGIGMLVMALLIAIGAFTHSWATQSVEDSWYGVGLLGLKASSCYEGECREDSMSWGEMDDRGGDDKNADVKFTGYLGFLGALAAMILCVVAGGMVLASNLRKVPTVAVTVVLGVAAGAMMLFLIRVLTKEGSDNELKLGYSGILAIGGAIGGVILSQVGLAPAIRRERQQLGMGGGYPQQPMPMGYPQQPMPMGYPQQPPMVMQQPLATACPRCNGPLQYVAQYQRNFCPACQQYA